MTVVSSTSSPFGQNEWLVEEMYRKFRDDPSSVDPSWHEFLVDYHPEPTTPVGTGQRSARRGFRPGRCTRPLPRRLLPRRPLRPGCPRPGSRPGPAPAPAPAPAADSAPAAAPAGDETQVLRGAAAAVVKNMNASLEIPTATSVRAIPATLMIDNRIVINNHLKRTRGGKISFTHLLGYAIVAVDQEVPEHEPPLRRDRRQAERGHPGADQSRSGNRPARQGRQAHAGGRCDQGLRDHWGSPTSSRPTRTSCAAPATASSPPRTSPG